MILELIQHEIIKRISAFYDKPLASPGPKERKYVKELAETINKLSQESSGSDSGASKRWANYALVLKEKIETTDPREFLRWDMILGTMFVIQAPYIIQELNYLKNSGDWERRWQNAIVESQAGHPLPYWRYPKSSGNLIHHAYHVALFEKEMGIPVDELDFVFEFGGGYGSMCRLFHNLGFKGQYVIFDLSHFCALQKFYLSLQDISLVDCDKFKTGTPGVAILSDLADLKNVLGDAPEQRSLFMTTWALSETPMGLRKQVLPAIAGFNSFLLAYQDQLDGINNADFFARWKEGIPEARWKQWGINQLPGNSYLMGTKKKN